MKIRIVITSLLVSLVFISCNTNKSNEAETDMKDAEVVNIDDIKPELLTAELFREKVWDYEKSPQEWVYNGDLPCIIDFYADWCKPCKIVAPIMDDLADHYKGRVLIYKVDTEKEKELATVFQVRSIPAVLFSPTTGKPAMQAGAMSKEDYIKIIDEFILKSNSIENNKNKL